MIFINGKLYSDFNSIPSHIINFFLFYNVYDFQLRYENGCILFWEKNYFMMMSQLRRLRLKIPMSFTLEFFINHINELIKFDKKKCYLINLKFANNSIPSKENPEPELILMIISKPVSSIVIKDINRIKEISLFKDFTFRDHELSSISYLQSDYKRIATIDAIENNFDDNIILNDKMNIIGSAIGNIFLLKENLILSPSPKNGAPSSTLNNLFIEYIKNRSHFVFSDEPFGVFELQIADELSILSFQSKIKPVEKYRKKTYEINRLPELFNSFVKTI